MNFLDPELTSDGKPYSIFRLKDIVQERYYISRNMNTSYADTGNITPLERDHLLQFLYDDLKFQSDEINRIKKESGLN